MLYNVHSVEVQDFKSVVNLPLFLIVVLTFVKSKEINKNINLNLWHLMAENIFCFLTS